MEDNFYKILAPVLAGTLRILLAYRIVVFTSPITMAFTANLYVILGLYALLHAIKNLKHLTSDENSRLNLFFLGFCTLFVSRGITDLYRYLSPIYDFHINATFLLNPTSDYPPFTELFASNLPVIALITFSSLAIYHIYKSKPSKNTDYYRKVLSLIDVLFVGVSTMLCLTHVYASMTSVLSIVVHTSHVLSGIYEPLASMVLFAPRIALPNKMNTFSAQEKSETLTPT